MTQSPRLDQVDLDGLREVLTRSVGGDVAFGTKARAIYSADASNYRHVPMGVVAPASIDDVEATVAAARAFDVPVVMRGGGTSVAGNAIGPGLVVDTSRYLTRIDDIDPDRRTARVQPGVVLDTLQAAASPYDLRFGPDPSTHSRCTIGGMIGNNACGSHSVRWGTTAQNIVDLDVLLYDGSRMTVGATTPSEYERVIRAGGRGAEVYASLRSLANVNEAIVARDFSGWPRRVSGYALNWLTQENDFNLARALVGTEGTCALVLGATVNLVDFATSRVLVVIGFPDAIAAADAVPLLLPLAPYTVECVTETLISLSRTVDVARLGLPEGRAWLLVEAAGASPDEALEHAHALASSVGQLGAARVQVITDAATQRHIWQARDDGAGSATRAADGSEAWPGWEDAAVPPERLGGYLRDFDALLDKHGRRGVWFGHFGEGCIHVRIDFDLRSPDGIAGYAEFVDESADLVLEYGGTLSGEHGDGQARSELLPKMFGPEGMRLHEQFKGIWDPGNRMNPGIVVAPRAIAADLRPLPSVRLLEIRPALAFAHDDGSIAKAVSRCVGVGKCRRESGPGVMCPSYMVTRQEEHSTRGRARILGEMLRGDVIQDGWQSSEVREAMDLCLGCKGCLSDCPVGVDMASYKTEFLHQHYAGKIRPRSHYSMGFLPLWARFAALAPRLVNRVNTSRLSRVIRHLGGIDPKRQLPPFAKRSFARWLRAHRAHSEQGGKPVLLWPDTFTMYFDPDVGAAAVEVLESHGYRIVLPAGQVCCGLTWMSTGQFQIARRVLRRTLAQLAPHLEAGLDVVVLEPSCAAMFRRDLLELLPNDDLAALLSKRALTLAELLVRDGIESRLPSLSRSAVMQTHCHQHAVLGTSADRAVLAASGIGPDVVEGCCGLAGNFGFENGHYDLSVAVGERNLLPAVRDANDDTLIMADGFSCRTQVRQLTDREPMHLAQVLRMGLKHGSAEVL